MASVSDYVLDGAMLRVAESNRLHLCSAEPTSYAEATASVSLGFAPISIGAPVAHVPSGRKIVVPPILNGTVTATGSGAFWALVDTANSRLAWTGAMQDPLAVNVGELFTTPAFDVYIPGAV